MWLILRLTGGILWLWSLSSYLSSDLYDLTNPATGLDSPIWFLLAVVWFFNYWGSVLHSPVWVLLDTASVPYSTQTHQPYYPYFKPAQQRYQSWIDWLKSEKPKLQSEQHWFGSYKHRFDPEWHRFGSEWYLFGSEPTQLQSYTREIYSVTHSFDS